MLCSFSAQAGENAGVLIVDLFLNEQHMGDSFVLVDENGAYLVDEAVLLDWEIKKPWPVATVFRGSNYYAVDAFAGASASLRSREMRLDVSMPATHMPVRKVALGWEDATARSEAFGLYLDYELNWLNYQQSDRESAHALLQPVVFGKYGNITANTIYHRNAGNELTTNYLLPSGLSILELTYTLDDPEKMRSIAHWWYSVWHEFRNAADVHHTPPTSIFWGSHRTNGARCVCQWTAEATGKCRARLLCFGRRASRQRLWSAAGCRA